MTEAIFARHAPALAAKGLPVFPVGGEDGKRPLVRKWQAAATSPQRVAALADRFPEANIGMATGTRSGCTIVDVDDANEIGRALERFGPTGIITKTPSGGAHLWYRAAGERNAQRVEEAPIDIRGEGGLALLPPSQRPRDGELYRFERGSLGDIEHLTPIREGVLPSPIRHGPLRGNRNATLHSYLLRQAPSCDDFDALLDVARTANDSWHDPLSDNEVIKTARSAWAMQVEGRNWVGQRARVVVPLEDIEAFGGNGDAFLLWTMLRGQHQHRDGGEFILAKSTSQVFGWTVPKFKRARGTLVEMGLLERTHEGGAGVGDPARFRLTRRGTKSYHNIKNTLPPQIPAKENR